MHFYKAQNCRQVRFRFTETSLYMHDESVYVVRYLYFAVQPICKLSISPIRAKLWQSQNYGNMACVHKNQRNKKHIWFVLVLVSSCKWNEQQCLNLASPSNGWLWKYMINLLMMNSKIWNAGQWQVSLVCIAFTQTKARDVKATGTW
jgi:hypothetical protein